MTLGLSEHINAKTVAVIQTMLVNCKLNNSIQLVNCMLDNCVKQVNCILNNCIKLINRIK